MIELFEPFAEAIVFSDDGFGRAAVNVTKAKNKAGLKSILNNEVRWSERKRERKSDKLD